MKFVAGLEITELVEHAVVGEVVLGVGAHHLALVEHRGGVLWMTAFGMIGLVGAVQISHHDNKIAKSGAEQAIGEAIDRGPRCFDEAAT